MRNIFGGSEEGGLRGSLLLWLLGVPIPVIVLLSVLRGCQ